MRNIILFLFGLLWFILPIPHTIGVRNTLFGLLLVFLIIELFRSKKFKDFVLKFDKKLIIILSVLTLWIFINTFFISKYTLIILPAIWGQWIIPLLYFLIGMLLGYLYSYKALLEIIITLLFIQILYINLNELKMYLHYHQIVTRLPGLTECPDKSNYLTNLLLAFLITGVIFRIRKTKQYLSFNNITLGVMLLLTILSSPFEGMRNGVVAILFLFISSLIFMFYKNSLISKTLQYFIALFLLLFISIPAYYNFTHDKRWDSLIQTIPIALNTTKYKAWLNNKKYPLPKLKNNKVVNWSNYSRIAWFKMSLEKIARNPLGYGYKRDIFKYAINSDKKFKNNKITSTDHSHSGIIDLTLAIGIPGLILWISFLIYLLYISIQYFKKYISYFSILLFFNVAGFSTRSIVDSNMRDHMFLMFMLVIGFAFFVMQKEINEKNNISST